MTIRAKSSIFNMMSAITYQLVTLLSGFFVRKFFLVFIGVEFLGFDGFFGNIISMLSLLDLGIGTASIFYISKSLAKQERENAIDYYIAYRRLYKYVALVMVLFGVIICLNIENFVAIGNESKQFIQIIFIFQFARTVSTYLLTCPRVAMQCYQRNYYNITVDSICAATFTIVKLIVIAVTKNYLFYLCVLLLEIVVTNLIIRSKFNKEFPEIKNVKEISIDNRNDIMRYTRGLIFVNINDFVYRSTDNMIITVFLGFKSVGYMSNYYYIFNAVEALFTQIFYSIAASVTNFIHDDTINSQENMNNLFHIVTFAGYVIILFCSVFLFGLTNEFIRVAFGQQYVLDKSIVMVMTLTFMFVGFQSSLYMYITGKGLVKKEIIYSVICTIVNLVISIFLIQKIGVIGVLIGTLCSTILFYLNRARLVINEVVFTYKKYIFRMITYILTIILCFLFIEIFLDFEVTSIMLFMLKGFLCFIVFSITLFCYSKCNEFNYLKNAILGLIKRK